MFTRSVLQINARYIFQGVPGGDLILETLAAPVDLWAHITSSLSQDLTPTQLWVAQDKVDLWVAQDKVEHFGCCAAVTAVAYLGALCHPRCARYRLPLSAICSVLVGVLKEAGDYLQVPI